MRIIRGKRKISIDILTTSIYLPSKPATYPANATSIFPNGGLASKKNVFFKYIAAYFP